ncbi:MAG: Na+/H+ antiporter NhaA [Chromatiaceae bacterium]
MSPLQKTFLERRLDLLRGPFTEFVRTQAAASGLLLLSLALALGLVNAGAMEVYESIQTFPIGVRLGDWQLVGNLLGWVNDGLIAVFFFLIGLEIKRELLAGELRSAATRRLVVAAALGGMVLPAVIYTLVNVPHPAGEPIGWGIPMATDTALAVGVLALAGSLVPRALTAFLVGLAIVDDMGAVLVIALFYTQSVQPQVLWLSLLLLGVLGFAGYAGVRHPLIYAAGTLGLWLGMHLSGIHASVAGILAAVTVPARPRMLRHGRARRLRRLTRRRLTPQADVLADEEQHRALEDIEREARQARTPLRSWEHSLQLPVGLLILPLFAFLNAGVSLEPERLTRLLDDPVALGVLLGLLVGKPAGICGACWLAARAGFVRLPEWMDRRSLAGIGLLAAIGFTMSTFIANLGLGGVPERLETAKLAILCASVAAGTGALLLLRPIGRST